MSDSRNHAEQLHRCAVRLFMAIACLALAACGGTGGGGSSGTSATASSAALASSTSSASSAVSSAAQVSSSAAASATSTATRTFYIDFSAGSDGNAGTSKTAAWKRAPGMTGFAGSYVWQAGDGFVFKGGVTWTASYPWAFHAGVAGRPTLYTVDAGWYAGASFTPPIFDDLGANPGTIGMANLTDAGYVTLNGLKFVNCGTAFAANGAKCLVFSNTNDVTLTNNIFATESWISVFFVFTTSGSYSGFVWTGNDFSRTSGAIWFASAAPNIRMADIVYNNNTFHDYSSQIGGGVHGDGAWHGFVVPDGDTSQRMENLQFCNNRFYGDFRRGFGTDGGMTGFFFQEGALHGALLCNNDMSFSPVQASMFDGLIVLSNISNPMDNIKVYNNSLVNAGVNAMSAAIHTTGDHGIALRNNIASGMLYPLYIENPGTAASFTSDYNLWNGTSGYLAWGTAPTFLNYTQWQAAGYDTHGLLGIDPAWVSPPGDLHLTAGSPATTSGANLYGLGIPLLNANRDGTARATSAVWNMGAY